MLTLLLSELSRRIKFTVYASETNLFVFVSLAQRRLQIPLPEPEPAGVLSEPPAGAAVSLRGRCRVGERHRDVYAVGRR